MRWRQRTAREVRTTCTMNGRALPLSLVLLLAVSAFPLAAQTPANEIALSAGHSDLGQLGDAPAAGISYNRYWRGGFSTRFGVFGAAEELTSDPDGGEKRIGAGHVSAEYHFLRRHRLSPYAGLGVAFAVNELEHANSDFSASESSFETIVSGGVDLNVTPRFALGADARFMYYDVGLGDRFGYQVDPLTVLVSAKFRY